MRSALIKILIFIGILFNVSCGLIDGKLIRPLGEIDLGSLLPTDPPPTNGGDTNTKINLLRPNGIINKMVVDSQGRKIYVGDFTQLVDHARGIIGINENGSRSSSFDEGLGAQDNALRVNAGAFQPDGKLVVVGRFTAMNGAQKTGIMRLNADGSPDSSFLTTGTSFGTNQYIYDLALQNDGKILVVGSAITGRIARVNSDGTLDTTFATNIGTGISGTPYTVGIQTDGKILIGGSFTSFNGTLGTYRLVRLDSNGFIDSTFTTNIGTGFDASIDKLKILDDGKILVAGSFTTFNGSASPPLLRLNSDGTLDNSFTAESFLNNKRVNEFALQNDGKLIIAGNFTGAGHNCLARLQSDGTHDPSFDSGMIWDCFTYGDYIGAINTRPNGQILVGGNKLTDLTYWSDGLGVIRHNSDGSVDNSFREIQIGYTYVYDLIESPDNTIIALGDFDWFGSTSNNYIYRETADGQIDTTFQLGTGFDSAVTALALLPDDSIIVGGSFTEYNGTASRKLAKILSDGTLDTSFNIGTGMTTGGSPFEITVQNDGNIIVAGDFTNYDGTAVNRLIRLAANGNLDTSFASNVGTAANSTIRCLNLLSDGSLIIGGNFTTFNSISAGRMAKIKPTGELDTTFIVDLGFNSVVNSCKIQSDGKIIAVGNFTTYKGATHQGIARLDTNGDADASFITGTGFGGSSIQSVAIQADSKILVGGYFTTYNGTSAKYITRLEPDGSIDSLFNTGTSFDSYIKNIILLDSEFILASGGNYGYQSKKSPYVTLINNDGSIFVNP